MGFVKVILYLGRANRVPGKIGRDRHPTCHLNLDHVDGEDVVHGIRPVHDSRVGCAYMSDRSLSQEAKCLETTKVQHQVVILFSLSPSVFSQSNCHMWQCIHPA